MGQTTNTRMTKSRANEIVRSCEILLRPTMDTGDLVMSKPTMVFDAFSVMVRFEFALVRNGVAMTREAQEFLQMRFVNGFDCTDLGREFMSAGTTLKVVGFKSRAPKRPVVCNDVLGRIVTMPLKAVLHEFHPERVNMKPADRRAAVENSEEDNG